MSTKRKLLAVGAVLAACAFAGGAYAASSDTNPKQAFLNDVAKRLNVSPQQLKSAFQGALHDQLNAAVKAGRLTRSQANAIEKGIRVGGGPPPQFFGPKVLRRGAFLGGGLLGAAANYIGVSPSQLFDQLGKSKSLAQLATAHGKTVSGLENAMVASERSRLDHARSKGLITSGQEQRLLSRLQQKIGALVNRAGFAPGPLPLMGPGGLLGPRGVPGKGPFLGPRMVPPAGLVPAGPPPLS